MGKIISLNIGNKGTLLSLKSGIKVKEKMFIEIFDENTLSSLREFFSDNKGCDVHIYLDTVAQNYTHKTFPAVNMIDLVSIVKRKFEQEIPKGDLKGKIFINRDKLTKKWNYMFVSASVDSPLKEWLEFLETVPNRLAEISMLPLEMQTFTNKLLKALKFSKEDKPKWVLIMVENQVSDVRQVALSDGKLIFTRLLAKDTVDSSFAGKIKADVVRTSEYLKRFSASFKLQDLTVITITSDVIKSNLQGLKITDFKLLPFTPYEVASKLGIGKSVTEDEKTSDLMLSSFIYKNKKILKFETPNMFIFNKIYIFYKIFLYSFFLLFLFQGSLALFSGFHRLAYNKKIEDVAAQITIKKKELKEVQEKEFGLGEENIDEIIDIINVSEIAAKNKRSHIDFVNNINNLQKGLALTFNIDWSLQNFDPARLNPNLGISSKVQFALLNESGNIDDLFKKYDAFSGALKRMYPDAALSKLPTNIDFKNKYYSFPLTVNITAR